MLLAGWIDARHGGVAGRARRGDLGSAQPFLDRYELLPLVRGLRLRSSIPSFYDGLPNVLVEAAALGVPLIASRTGGMADVLEDDRTALLFEPGDEAGCGWALERAAAWPRERRRAGRRLPRKLAERELDQRVEAPRYAELLAETLPASEPTPLPAAARRRAAP